MPSAADEAASRPSIWTVGHSTRTTAELLALLEAAGVRALADVRRFPASRRNPQHERRALQKSLGEAGLRYAWLGEGLGGRQPARLPAERSPNRAWTVPAFRHYADAMTTTRFQAAFAELEALARAQPTALMCAERLWWRCHRRLLADLLTVRGWRVFHLIEPGSVSEHALCEWTQVRDGELSYPALL